MGQPQQNKLPKVSYLSIVYNVLIGLLLLLFAFYNWRQIELTSQSLYEREALLGKQEAVEAINTVAKRILAIEKSLSEWDESRQQLMYRQFYPLWRDQRVRSAGLVPETINDIALYDRNGRILAPSGNKEPMPDNMPRQGGTLYVNEGGHIHMYSFFPIFAESGGGQLLGYGGLAFDLVDQLRMDRQYRYLDLSTIRMQVPSGTLVDRDSLIKSLSFELLPNPNLDKMRSAYQVSFIQLSVVFLLVQVVSAWLLQRYFTRPLRELSEEIDSLRDLENQEDNYCRIKPLPIRELEELRQSFYDYHNRLLDLNQNLERSSQNFYDQARRDPMTGVFNRRAYDEDWHSLDDANKIEQCSLILFDCDHFKAINDSYGHHVGDSVIKSLASILQSTLRGEDRLYRLGGDEFATVLARNDADNAEAIAARCLEQVLSHDFQQFGVIEPVTISIGIAHGNPGVALGDLQKQADIAMYAAKRPTSRKIEVFGERLNEVSPLLTNKSISAIYQTIQDPFLMEMHYQPVIDLKTREPAYVEALTRIKIDGEIIRPNEIFPVVQARRVDAEFDQAVIQAVQRDLEFKRIPEHLGVSINVSAVGLLSSKVTDMLVYLKLAYPEIKMVVEITETALIDQIEQATLHIHKLREAGCLVALDDFGSGYSSLRYLASMPVDLVKFDISMMRLLEKGDVRQKEVIREVARLVTNAGYKMVAEGIETHVMLEQVVGLGFDYAQGFLFEPALNTA
ncbi:MAG: bifunctional diguanylate cyclase/phosphodiesterase [Betaproteobacteria bacterium]|nr:bifunctional diguanylate cyclase/phosphodiesterase [Betaproteobacteria bacterium]